MRRKVTSVSRFKCKKCYSNKLNMIMFIDKSISFSCKDCGEVYTFCCGLHYIEEPNSNDCKKCKAKFKCWTN